MRVLFTGKGKAGSWQVRGEQLGYAFGAKVIPNAAQHAIACADMVVVVKHCPQSLLYELNRQNKPWVFDVLDSYPQPCCTNWSRDYAINWIQQRIAAFNPSAVIWPNEQMRIDCGDSRPDIVLYHHFRPSMKLHQVKDQAQKIAYEGAAQYLGSWERFMMQECRNRGMQFIVNPAHLEDCDAVIAVRDEPYAGYVQSHWKSNIKLANAQGCGVPFIGQRECSYVETKSGAELFINSKYEMAKCLDMIDINTVRYQMHHQQLTKRYSVNQAANDLKDFLYAL